MQAFYLLDVEELYKTNVKHLSLNYLFDYD
jgi:hypothetical protein